jgi:hypothetical protein
MPTPTLAAEWARCRPYIEAAIRHSPQLETIADVERLISCGKYQFWPGKRSAAITEIAEFARGLVLIVVHGGGDLAELVDLMEPAFCGYARAHGCIAIAGMGRKGWQRATEKRGYRFGTIMMIKDI